MGSEEDRTDGVIVGVSPPEAAAAPPTRRSGVSVPLASGILVAALILGVLAGRALPKPGVPGIPGATHAAAVFGVEAVMLSLHPVSGPVASQETDPNWKNCESTDPDAAIAGCTTIIQANRETSANLAVAYQNRAYANHNKHQYDAAIADYTQAIKLAPGDANAYAGRGHSEVNKTFEGHLSDYSVAKADFQAAVRLDPRNPDSQTGLGDAFAGETDFANAVSAYDKAIELLPGDEPAYVERGGAYLGLHQLDKALADDSKAIQIDPKADNAYASRCAVENQLNQFDSAIADCNQALDINAQNALALAGRAVSKLHKGDLQGAFADNEAARAIDPSIPSMAGAPAQ